MNDNMLLRKNRYSRGLIHGMTDERRRYMPGIDGLRAFSVMAVIAYHLNAKWAQGGLLGVGIFFVISGYLITDQIIQEWKQQHRLDLFRFWVRRARRLMPAMLTMLAFVGAWLLCTQPGRLRDLGGAFLSSLFYVNNWWLIFHQVSYFESFGPPSPIGHLWSLSIEEQFYLLWPLMLVVGLDLFCRRGKLTLMILGLAAISALVMAINYVPGTDPSRVYYGTDSRAFALLIGAGLAVVWPSWKLSAQVSALSRGMMNLIGIMGLTVLIVLIYRTNEYNDFLYRGGFLLISLLSAAVIAVLAHPASWIANVMGCKGLRWIGVRSYSLYIWHFPVIVLTNPDVHTEGSSTLRILLQLAITFLLAACSYQYIEEPFRRGRFHMKRNKHRLVRPILLSAIVPMLLFTVACGHYMLNKPDLAVQTADSKLLELKHDGSEIKTEDKTNGKAALGQTATTNQQTPKQQQSQQQQPAEQADQPSQVLDTGKETVSSAEADRTASDSKLSSGKGITAIGDSVMLDAAPFLEKMLPGIVVDGKVGRQMRQAAKTVDQLKARGQLGDQIIIELGTNGPFSKKQLRSLLQSLGGDKQIILVNTRVPRGWQDTVNQDISEVSSEFGNVKVVDWYSASEGKDDFFYKDGVHLNREGAEFYASLLVKTVKGQNH